MAETFLLVDYENVRDVALSGLPEGHCVKIFIGRSQKSIPSTTVIEAQPLGGRIEWIKIEGDGKNNLDFHLAFHLGRLIAANPDAAFVIVSQDKGFDPLIEHIKRRGGRVVRDATLASCRSPLADTDDPHFVRACSVLSKIDKKSRPRRRKTLSQHIASNFQKKLPDAEVQRIVESLFSKGLVAETGSALMYHF